MGKLTGRIADKSTIIPYVESSVRIDDEGNVTRNGLPLKTIVKEGKPYVKVKIAGEHRHVSVSKLIVMAFKGLSLSLENMRKLRTFHIDGNQTNFAPDNIVYVPQSPLEAEAYPGFFHIPAYTGYAVSHSGELVNVKTGFKLKWVNHANYLKVSIKDDFGKDSMLGIHRAKKMALEAYPINADDLHVDHKDENSFNNELDNLQWLTPKGNTEKAKANQNNRQHLKLVVEVLNCETYKVTECSCPYAAARVIGAHCTTVDRYLNKDQLEITTGNFMLRYKHEAEKKPWPKKEDIDLDSNARRNGMTKPVIARYAFYSDEGETPEYAIFESVGQTAKMIGTCSSKISDALISGDPVPFKGYNFAWFFGEAPEDHNWPKWSKEELTAMKLTTKTIINLIVLTSTVDGTKRLFCGWDAVVEQMGRTGARDAYQEGRLYDKVWRVSVYRLPRTYEDWMSADWVTKRCEYVNCKEELKPTTTT